MTQEPFSIEHHGLTIRGTQYLPALSGAIQQRVATVVVLHGFAGHRIGPAAMFVQVARLLNILIGPSMAGNIAQKPSNRPVEVVPF